MKDRLPTLQLPDHCFRFPGRHTHGSYNNLTTIGAICS